MHRISSRFFSFLTVGLVLAATSSLAPAQAPSPGLISDGVVKIGVLTDLSGPTSDFGRASLVAAKMAAEDFGGKVLGADIEIVAGDSQNKADIASVLTRTWFDRNKVDMITDLGITSVATAAVAVAAEKNKLAIAVSAAGTNLTNENCTPVSIHWMYDTYALSSGTARALVERGLKKWYFVTVDYAFGKALEKDASDLIRSLGGEVVGTARHPLNSMDMSSPVVSAMASKAQVIALANSNADTVNFIKSATSFGVAGSQYVAPLVMYIDTVHGLGLKQAQEMYVTEAFYWDRTPESRTWARRFFERHKAMPNSLAAGVYSSVLNYLRAVQAAGTDETAAVNKTLRSMRIKDPIIPDGFIRSDGRLVHDMYLFQVKKPAESKEPWDYYKTVKAIDGNAAFAPLERSRCPLVTARK